MCMDLYAGADPHYRLPVQVIAEYAWHALFVKQLFVRPEQAELAAHRRRNSPSSPRRNFDAVPERDGTRSETFILADFTRKIILDRRHQIRRRDEEVHLRRDEFPAARSAMSFPCTARPTSAPTATRRCSSGSPAPARRRSRPIRTRRLIGDDEHGWSSAGVFNFEGGCYAKCVDLSEEKEPQIYHAIRFGSVLENVVLDPRTGEPDYSDIRYTENTRAAYPVEFIENAVVPGVGGHPRNVMFLAADAFGVLPPIARLTPEQAMYHFLSGYTAKLAGTEAGLGSEPVPEFSTCFASPFLPLPPQASMRRCWAAACASTRRSAGW